jgi:hypothetical protein
MTTIDVAGLCACRGGLRAWDGGRVEHGPSVCRTYVLGTELRRRCEGCPYLPREVRGREPAEPAQR